MRNVKLMMFLETFKEEFNEEISERLWSCSYFTTIPENKQPLIMRLCTMEKGWFKK